MFKWLFGNSSAAEKAVDGVVDGLDALVFTDEEKSVAAQKVLDFKIEYAKVTQNQSISRRIITVAVCFMWLVAGLIVLLAEALGDAEFAEFAMQYMTNVINNPFMIIVTFYFASHVVGKLGGK